MYIYIYTHIFIYTNSPVQNITGAIKPHLDAGSMQPQDRLSV